MRAAVDLTPQGSHIRHEYVADLAWAMEMSGDLHAADALLAEDVELARTEGDELGEAHVELARLDVATTFSSISIQEVIRRSERLLTIFEKAGDRRGIASAILQLARHHFFGGHAGVSNAMLREHLASYGPDEQPPILHFGMLMGATYWGPTPVPEAVAELEALETHQRRGLEALRLRTLGALHGLKGEFDVGRRMILDGIELERPLGRKIMSDAAIGHFLGPLETAAGNLEEAERLLLGAYESMAGRGDTAFSSTVAANLAHVYLVQGRLDDAHRYADIARSTSAEDDVDAQARGRALKARALAARGEVTQAVSLAREAVAIADQTDYLDLRGTVHSHLAETLLSDGQIEEGVAELRRALEIFDEKGAKVLADETRRRLREVEETAARG